MKISLLMPCHNEEKGLEKSLISALSQTRLLDQIVVVNDGSTDETSEILGKFAKKHKCIDAINLGQNTGNKSKAQEIGLLFVTGDVVVMTDGDTIMDSKFVEKIEQVFLNDEKNKLAAVCGRVKSIKHNWITACREIDYTIGFDVFKQAQSILGYVFVMPGCATAIRTDVLKSLTFCHDTVTEDLDFTYQIHLKNLVIVYEKDALVFTQDPPNLRSYTRQMRRWYGGGWQNLIKYYRIIFIRPVAALELSLMFGEGLFYSFFILFILISYPTFFVSSVVPFYLAITFIFSTYAAIKNRRPELVLFSPFYLFIVFLNAGISVYEFFNEVVFRKKSLVWLKADRI